MAAAGMTPEEVWSKLRRDWWIATAATACQNKRDDRAETIKKSESGEADWFELVTERRKQLEACAARQHQRAKSELVVVVADTEPMSFLAGFWAGVLSGWTVALANPNWTSQEWQSVYRTVDPHVVWGTTAPPKSPDSCVFLSPRPSGSSTAKFPAILISTGGTSGQLKFAHHTWTTLTTAALGFQQHFRPHAPINSYCVLPLYHVSGLMQAMRTWLTGGQLLIVPFKTLLLSSTQELGKVIALEMKSDQREALAHPFISLVPTQLSRLITAGKASWLRQFQAVLLGGAPPWPDLLDHAVKQQIPVCLSYGMTETGAMVSAMRSPNLSKGFSQRSSRSPSQTNFSSGRPMPHAAIRIEHGEKPMPSGEVGQIVVTSGAIAHGYYNAPSPSFEDQTFYTDDLGYLDDCGQLHVTGRASGKIISGGENVFPEEVESALRSTGQVLSVCVIGLSDTDWGEVVTAAYVPAYLEVSADSLKAALDQKDQLSRYKYPKRWITLDSLPENAQGKVNRLRLRTLLDQLSNRSSDCQ